MDPIILLLKLFLHVIYPRIKKKLWNNERIVFIREKKEEILFKDVSKISDKRI